MSRWRAWIGVGLIVVSAAALIYWETQGREAFLTKPVLVAAQEIPAGTVVTSGAFTPARIQRERVAEGALGWEDRVDLEGRSAGQLIPKNQQVIDAYFISKEERLEAGESVYVLPGEWISMRSSSLRKGDRISVYGAHSLTPLGQYRLAFVKDREEQEVTDPGGGLKSDALARTYSTAEISHVEIISTLDEYGQIRSAVASEGGVLLVQNQEVYAAEGESAVLHGGKAGKRGERK